MLFRLLDAINGFDFAQPSYAMLVTKHTNPERSRRGFIFYLQIYKITGEAVL
jgi:hypothetical protein